MPIPDDLGAHWILDEENRPVRVGLMEWARWFENFELRRVAETFTTLHRVSTVFLGLDHRFGFGKGPPLLFETMVFEQAVSDHPRLKHGVSEELEGTCWRYSSWDEAEAGHFATVRKVQKIEADALTVAKGKTARNAPKKGEKSDAKTKARGEQPD